MRLFLRFIFICVLLSVSAAVTGQVVTTNPVAVTSNSTSITITFHADGGNKGLMGSPSTTGIYAHTGVITDKSNGAWKYAPTWGDNAEKYKLKYVSANTWTLTIPDVRSYYGITDTSEAVLPSLVLLALRNTKQSFSTVSEVSVTHPHHGRESEGGENRHQGHKAAHIHRRGRLARRTRVARLRRNIRVRGSKLLVLQ